MLHVPGVHGMLASDLLGESAPRDPVGRLIGGVGSGTGRRHAKKYNSRGAANTWIEVR
jgi:hypothetical protein